jgi:uncharacterized lipoprotein YmbA
MAIRNVRLISIALAAVAIAGCGTTAPSRFYTLESVAATGGAPTAHTAVMVGPVSIPAVDDQPQIVVEVAPNRVEVDEFNRWAAPLNDSIGRVVAGDLSSLLDTPNVATWPLANFSANYRVTIDVQRFQSIKGQAAVLDAVWVVSQMATGISRSGRTVAREPVQGDGFDALAAAHSLALAQMSGDISTAIREEAQSPSQFQRDSSLALPSSHELILEAH